jgi:cytochrome c-type biogenesis protein CcmH
MSESRFAARTAALILLAMGTALPGPAAWAQGQPTGVPVAAPGLQAPAPGPRPAAASPTAPKAAQPMAADPVLEARVLAIAAELRCLVCQNETLAASHADLAVDLRRQIRHQLTEGRSERQILDFMVERYGDFVLYRPPLKTTTALLWVGPFALLLVAVAVGAAHVRRRRRALGPTVLSPAEAERARALLTSGQEPR